MLGDYGVRECADILRRYGVNLDDGAKVYAANHVRALLDMLIASLRKKHVPDHVNVEDMLDSPDSMREFHDQLSRLKHGMTDQTSLSLLQQWEARQP
jgi:hypothetical protein